MKKLLSILSAVIFTASAGSTVVACGKSSSSKSKDAKDGILWPDGDGVVAALPNGQKIRINDYMKNATNLDSYLLNELNHMVANKYAEDYNQANITSSTGGNLGLSDPNFNYTVQGNKDGSVNTYADEISNYNYISLATSLYQDYVNSIKDVTPYDQTAAENSTYLNPISYNGKPTRQLSIWFKSKGSDTYKRWTTDSETDNLELGKSYLPTADDLNTTNFELVQSNTLPTGDNDSLLKQSDIDTLPSDKDVLVSSMSGQRALTYRFQQYLQTKNDSSMINALVMEYAKNNMYKLQGNPTDPVYSSSFETQMKKGLYIDTTSTFAKDVQSWPDKATDKITSNYKMVWSITVPSGSAGADAFNKDMQDLTKTPDSEGLSGNDYSVFDKGTTINQVFEKLTSAISSNGNLAKKGTDPIFGESGYQGIVKDGKLVDSDNTTLDIDSTAAGKIASAEGFGILKNTTDTSGNNQYAFNSTSADNKDFIIVMPIYLMDLLRSGTANATPPVNADASANALTNIATNQWVELNPQSADAKWNSTDNFTFGSDLADYSKAADKTVLPTKDSYIKYNGKSYIYLTDATPHTITTSKGEQVTVTGADEAANSAKDLSGYGISGTYVAAKNASPEAQALNGTTVTYPIHLGADATSAASYQTNWQAFHTRQDVNDIANLTNSKKTDLMNELLAIVAKNDTTIQEETKNNIYRGYISLDDIFYKGLRDQLSKYLKEDDSTDASD